MGDLRTAGACKVLLQENAREETTSVIHRIRAYADMDKEALSHTGTDPLVLTIVNMERAYSEGTLRLC